MNTRHKMVFELLDASINGVNRFISSSVPFAEPLRSYQERGWAIRFSSTRETLEVAEALLIPLMNGVPSPRASNVDECLSGMREILSAPEVLLGSREICNASFDAVTPTVRALYAERSPLVFTLLGYPHKMPNPLYTISTGADLGEVFSLMKLSRIMERISTVYPFGVKLHVLTENTIFFGMSDIPEHEQQRYFLDLCRWAKLVDPRGYLIVEDIVAYHTPELAQAWKEVTSELHSRYLAGERAAVDMVDSVMPTNFMTLNYRNLPREILTRVFDAKCHDAAIEAVRRAQYERALGESFRYLAYHQARYRLGFMEETFPNSLRLTVAPKVGSFGVRMLNATAHLLPYYGYIVREGDTFSFRYIVDVPREAIAVYDPARLEYPMYFELGG